MVLLKRKVCELLLYSIVCLVFYYLIFDVFLIISHSITHIIYFVNRGKCIVFVGDLMMAHLWFSVTNVKNGMKIPAVCIP